MALPMAAFVTRGSVKVKKYSDEFIAKYEGQQPPWGPLGWVVFQRTYARWIPAEQRKETWTECVRRVLEGNFNIIEDDASATQEEMEKAFDHMWHMRWLPPGRGLWISGTDHAKRNGSALNNCYFVSVRPEAYDPAGPPKASFPFVFAMDMLMLGGGVGGSVTRENVRKFGKVKKPVNLVVVCDPRHANVKELESEGIPPRDKDYTYIRVKDSRRGWTDALRVVVDAHFKKGPYDYTLVLDVSDVRKAGDRIKGFGGTSAGPGPLVQLLRKVNELLNARVGKMMGTETASDVFNLIGKCVVAGNVRRSAEILVGDADDKTFRDLKLDQDALMSHRWASNNSVVVDDTFNDYESIAKAIGANGEPGIVNLERMRNYGRYIDGETPGVDALVEGTNPCGEITLESGEPCNLAEIFPAICLRDGVDVEEVAAIATRYSKRVTFTKHEWHILTSAVERNRRIGVSLSGWEDFKLMYASMGKTTKDRQDFLSNLYSVVAATDRVFSKQLGCNESIKLSTVKPSGTISLLNGSSAGRHAHYAPYYIRRIRMQEKDPLVAVLTDAGFYSEPDVASPNTTVVEFPVMAPTAKLEGFKAASDYTLEEQMQDQMELQTYWADNSVSSTLTFTAEEADLIPDLLRKYRFKSTSLLPYFGHGYAQAPNEPISKEEYLERFAQIKYWPTEKDLLKDKKDIDLIGTDECATGACPVK